MNRTGWLLSLGMLAAIGGGVALAAQDAPSFALGKALFNDAKLGNSKKSCGTCHPDVRCTEKVNRQENLQTMIIACISRLLKGPSLDVKPVEMQSLLLYIRSLAPQ